MVWHRYQKLWCKRDGRVYDDEPLYFLIRTRWLDIAVCGMPEFDFGEMRDVAAD